MHSLMHSLVHLHVHSCTLCRPTHRLTQPESHSHSCILALRPTLALTHSITYLLINSITPLYENELVLVSIFAHGFQANERARERAFEHYSYIAAVTDFILFVVSGRKVTVIFKSRELLTT